ncbi:MAG: EAL domain-containing protein [Gammaproteobacteria bacterium]|nr:EAL domain-containing protein [Gammaproteobacteria bacterium]MCP5424893.1 EAL domain-containing protein [Gammaproteobacteria bacterium]MCP5458131.1 EAL domain-containing protein [Gammaproteobacteria bacterium]
MPTLKLLVFENDPVLGNLIADVAEKTGFETKMVTDRAEFEALYRLDTNLLVIDLGALSKASMSIGYLLHQLTPPQQANLVLIGDLPDQELQHFAESAEQQGMLVIGTLTKPFTTGELTRLFQEAWLALPLSGDNSGQMITREELYQCLIAEDLVAYYQPKVNPRSGDLAGVEVLARLSHPTKGLILPGLFIPLAEEGGMITVLLKNIANQAFAQCAAWTKQGLRLKIAINVSIFNLNEAILPETLSSLASQHRVKPDQIILEITESGLLKDAITPLNVLAQLAQQGVDLSIDDFGTGYATIQQLQRIPFSELKIDRFFVHEAVKNQDSLVILESMFAMARKLGMRVVAEGVETQQHWDLLSRLGCDQVQGYLIGKPMPGPDLPTWLEHWKEHSIELLINSKKPLRLATQAHASQSWPETSILIGWYLEGVFDQSGVIQRLPINQMPFRIGRQAGLHLRIASAEVSREHAEIFRRGNHLVIRDLGSTNGTFVNGERVALETRINANDRLSFAQIQFRLIHDPNSDGFDNDDRPSAKLTSAIFSSQRRNKPAG